MSVKPASTWIVLLLYSPSLWTNPKRYMDFCAKVLHNLFVFVEKWMQKWFVSCLKKIVNVSFSLKSHLFPIVLSYFSIWIDSKLVCMDSVVLCSHVAHCLFWLFSTALYKYFNNTSVQVLPWPIWYFFIVKLYFTLK